MHESTEVSISEPQKLDDLLTFLETRVRALEATPLKATSERFKTQTKPQSTNQSYLGPYLNPVQFATLLNIRSTSAQPSMRRQLLRGQPKLVIWVCASTVSLLAILRSPAQAARRVARAVGNIKPWYTRMSSHWNAVGMSTTLHPL